MPSGAKKRKAAKKKKEKEASFTTHSHGDELKHQDDKGSDGGEVSSPASQDHHNHQHPFTEGEEEEVEKREIEVEGVVRIDREVKPLQESEINKPARKSHNTGSSSSSSSSSSDDESHVVKKEVVMETVPVVDSVLEVVTQVTDSIPVENTYNSVVETIPIVDLDKASLVQEVVRINENVSVDNSATSQVIESGLKENGAKKLPTLDENVGVSHVVMDLASEKKKNEVVPASDKNGKASEELKGLAAQGSDDKLLLSYNAPKTDARNGAENVKDSEVPESSDSKPLIASAPRPMQTSWMSCCGLLEAFTGSNR